MIQLSLFCYCLIRVSKEACDFTLESAGIEALKFLFTPEIILAMEHVHPWSYNIEPENQLLEEEIPYLETITS